MRKQKSTLVIRPCLHVHLLYFLVHPLLNGLPNLVSPGAEDVAAGDVVVVDHLRESDHLRVCGHSVNG